MLTASLNNKCPSFHLGKRCNSVVVSTHGAMGCRINPSWWTHWGVIVTNCKASLWRKEGNVSFNDALNTFYLRLYGIRHMVKDHSDSEKGNPLPPHRLLLSINSKGYFYMHHPTDRITHTTAFVTPVVEHWLEREIAQWVHPMKDRSDDPSHHERTLYLWATSRSLIEKRAYEVAATYFCCHWGVLTICLMSHNH